MNERHNLLVMQGFAALLKVYIDRAGFSSLRAFARAAGCAVSTVQGCVRGTRAPPIPQIPKWCKVLKLTPELARDFTFAAYRTKGWKQPDARPYITAAEEALATASEELRAAEADLQDANRRYAEHAAELAWSLTRNAQLEAELRKHSLPVPPPPPHQQPPSPPAPPPAST